MVQDDELKEKNKNINPPIAKSILILYPNLAVHT